MPKEPVVLDVVKGRPQIGITHKNHIQQIFVRSVKKWGVGWLAGENLVVY
jgi:hypothetical protein